MSYIPGNHFELALQSEPRIEVALGEYGADWRRVEHMLRRTIDRAILMYAWSWKYLADQPFQSWDQDICEGSGNFEMIPPMWLAHRDFTLTASGLVGVRGRLSEHVDLVMGLHGKGINLHIDNHGEPEQPGDGDELTVNYTFEVEVHPVGIKMATVYLREHAVTESDLFGPQRPSRQGMGDSPQTQSPK